MYIINSIIVPYILSHKFYFIMYTLLSFIVYSIGSILIPRSITEFINSKTNNETFGINILKSIQSKSKIGILYLIGIFFILYSILQYFKENIENDILYSFSSNSKKEIIKDIFYKYTTNYKEIPESQVSWMIENSYGTIRFIIRYLFVDLIMCFIMFIVISMYFLYYDKMIGYIFILQFCLLASVLYIYHNDLLNCYSEYDTKLISNNNYIGDKIKNLMNILFDNSIQTELSTIMKKEDHLLDKMKKCYDINDTIFFIVNSLSYILFFIIIYKLLYKDAKNTSTILIIFLLYKGIQDKFLNNTLYQYFGFSKLLKINDFIQIINDNDSCKPIRTFSSIKLSNISYRYDEKNDYVLRNVNIEFKGNQINVLMGKSGSGKTTIMKLIIKMYTPTQGTIYFDSINSKDLCQTDIRNNIYYVNQRTILFEESVLYNLQYGNNVPKEKIIELLKQYELIDYYDRLQNGIDSNCGVNGSNLSLGMQKIIMVIRGILKPNKQIIIFDEPLTSLDTETRVKIVKLIKNETKGKTIIVISHDPEILPYADNIIRL